MRDDDRTPAAGTGRFTSHAASHQAPGARHGTPMLSALAAALPQAQRDKGASSPQSTRHHGLEGFLLLPKPYGFTSSKPTATWTAMGMEISLWDRHRETSLLLTASVRVFSLTHSQPLCISLCLLQSLYTCTCISGPALLLTQADPYNMLKVVW